MHTYYSQISENISLTDEGYLFCRNIPIARTGVQEYGKEEVPIPPLAGKDSVLIHRLAEDVFAPETVKSFEGKSITLLHPLDDGIHSDDGFVNPENWKKLTCGVVFNVRQGEENEKDLLLADFLITDATAISKVKSGLRQVSCGYDARYEEIKPGVGRQFNIRGNHVALVPEGRCGARCAIKDEKKDEKMPKKPSFLERLLAKPEVKKAFDEALEEESKDEEKNPKTSDDEETKQQIATDDISRLEAKLDELMLMLRSFFEKEIQDKGNTEDETENKEQDGAEEKQEDEAENLDTKEKDKKAKDVSFKTADATTLRQAKILAPHIKARVGDADCLVKRSALRSAQGDKRLKRVIDSCLGGLSIDAADCLNLDAAFFAASELAKIYKNQDTADALSKAGQAGPSTITPDDINKANEDFYKKGK